MNQQRDRSDQKQEPKKKFQIEIKSWLGHRKDGHWVPQSVATNSRRTFSHIAKAKGWTLRDPKSVVQVTEELIYVHHGYRPKFEGEKETRKSFYFRGARVWR